ncbi:alpha/beta-hydrolase [Massarina eburnea CBS 473.64]|uniref:Alpha/beta-hydrolase n=1 Tax=Massarina eburnea CBS 473.64 TaxID=1395130 RepID=A0A6A6RK79_9PLEO|nr:alpha/beta-hydrolase [Massarina eburnea CBS 473.64]
MTNPYCKNGARETMTKEQVEELEKRIQQGTREFEPFLNFYDELAEQKGVDWTNAMEKRVDWFKEFKKEDFPWKETNTWDCHILKCYVLIPQNLNPDKEILVHCVFHGGGGATGGGLFEPWFCDYRRDLALRNNAITLIPNYRLMPESSGEDIEDDVNDWWRFYESQHFDESLRSIGIESKNVKKERLLVSGESAGGLLVVNTWLGPPRPPIRALYLQYPMLNYYKRAIVGDQVGYRGENFPLEDVKQGVDKMLQKCNDMRSQNTLPCRSDTQPPYGMSAANALSSTKKWTEVFKGDTGTMDVPTRLDYMVRENITPSQFPEIFIAHGEADTVCPVEHTDQFHTRINALWGDRVKVTYQRVPEKDHAFDYEAKIDENWLVDIIEGIEKVW